MKKRKPHIIFNKKMRKKYKFYFTRLYKGVNIDTIWITGHAGFSENESHIVEVRKDAEKYFGPYLKEVYFKDASYPSSSAIVIKLYNKI